MRQPLSVAAAQPGCLPCDVAANALKHAATVRVADARVVVFPELSLTGYQLDAPAITVDDLRLSPVVEACLETGSIALLGAPLREDSGRSYIATLAVDGTGVRVAYRKVWVDESEAPWFTAGEKPAIIEVDGWRLGLAICKDTGIPQHWADTAALGIDAYLAGTVMHSHETAEQNRRATRIATDHHVWVVIASFAGSTGHGYEDCAGASGVWTPEGAVLTQAAPEVDAVARATLR